MRDIKRFLIEQKILFRSARKPPFLTFTVNEVKFQVLKMPYGVYKVFELREQRTDLLVFSSFKEGLIIEFLKTTFICKMDKVLDRSKAHPKAQELIQDGFFWSCVDEYAPFGSDEGYTALVEWRRWRKENPTAPTLECIAWVIESISGMEIGKYYSETMSKNPDLKTTHISVIATAFGQLIDEGKIDGWVTVVLTVALLAEKQDAPSIYAQHIDEYFQIIKSL